VIIQVPFARVNFDEMRSFAAEAEVTELPAIVLFQEGRPLLYLGVHTREAIVGYVQKLAAPAFQLLNTTKDVYSFVESQSAPRRGLSAAMV
jgi:thioredoxin-like negative regulator of GroEL